MGLRFFWYRLKMINPSESEIMPTTILVDVQLQRIDADEHDASLQELRQLIETLGWEIAGALTQKMSSLTAASLIIGPGKLEELSELVKAPPEVDSVVFDHELERRQVRDRIRELQRELDAVHTEQVERRRHREGLSKVAIVGYTNSGKSSLMRALTSSDVLVADQLFATLDRTVRALQPETQPRILVSDTV